MPVPAARRLSRGRDPCARRRARTHRARSGDAADDGRARRLLRRRRSRVPPPGRAHRARPRRAARQRRRRAARRGGRDAALPTATPAPRRSTSRSSTSTTSTTCGCSRPRSCPRSPPDESADEARPMKFGVHAGLAEHDDRRAAQALWRRIEGHGFDWISVWDHFYAADATGGAVCLEAVATHAALALATERVRCGSLVYSVGYRHPAVLANAIATIDHLSGGRVTLGLGAGWHQGEYDAYGIPFPSAGRAAAPARRGHPVHPRPAHRGRHQLRGRVLPAARRPLRAQAGPGAAAALDRRRRREGHAAHRGPPRRRLERAVHPARRVRPQGRRARRALRARRA